MAVSVSSRVCRSSRSHSASSCDEPRHRLRQVVGRFRLRLQRRKLPAQRGCCDLPQPFRLGETFQPMLPQVQQRNAVRQRVLNERAATARYHHLPAMSDRGDPLRAGERLVTHVVDCVTVTDARARLTGVQADAHPDRRGRPRFGLQRML